MHHCALVLLVLLGVAPGAWSQTGTGDCSDGKKCPNGGICANNNKGSKVCYNKCEDTANPCFHDGKCTNTNWNEYECDCTGTAGFRGPRCGTSTACDANPCKHGGSCVLNGGGSSGYQCSCKDNYSGKNCQTDQCQPNPCTNGGTCQRRGNGGTRCDCPNGFSGKRCGTDSCEPSPCLHGGTCSHEDGDSGFTCTCKGNGWTTGREKNHPLCDYDETCLIDQPCNKGKCTNTAKNEEGKAHACDCHHTQHLGANCQIDPCGSNPCQNGGSCQGVDGQGEIIATWRCTCAAGFTGKSCEKDLCNPNPCKHQSRITGKCSGTESGDRYTCACYSGWENGKSAHKCGQDIDECDTGNGGCDEFSTCNNVDGSWYCGACDQKDPADQQCCTATGENPVAAERRYGPQNTCCSGKDSEGNDPCSQVSICNQHQWNSPGCTGRADARHSSAQFLPAADCAVAPATLTLSVTPKDARDNPTAQNGVTKPSAFTVSGWTGREGEDGWSNFLAQKSKYVSTITENQAGPHDLILQVYNSNDLSAHIQIVPGPLPAKNCFTDRRCKIVAAATDKLSRSCLEATGDTWSCHSVAGKTITFRINLYDQFGNERIPTSGSQPDCKIQDTITASDQLSPGSLSPTAFDSDRQPGMTGVVAKWDGQIGSYKLAFSRAASGKASIRIAASGSKGKTIQIGESIAYEVVEVCPKSVEGFMTNFSTWPKTLVAGQIGRYSMMAHDDYRCPELIKPYSCETGAFLKFWTVLTCSDAN